VTASPLTAIKQNAETGAAVQRQNAAFSFALNALLQKALRQLTVKVDFDSFRHPALSQ
jgi:hypothetical protein